MTVSFVIPPEDGAPDILMKEVSDIKEAFFEIGRFLEVNHIFSDATEVKTVDYYRGRPIAGRDYGDKAIEALNLVRGEAVREITMYDIRTDRKENDSAVRFLVRENELPYYCDQFADGLNLLEYADITYSSCKHRYQYRSYLKGKIDWWEELRAYYSDLDRRGIPHAVSVPENVIEEAKKCR